MMSETPAERQSELIAKVRRLYTWPSQARVAYLATEGDEILPIMESMGARFEMLGPTELELSDLGEFHGIIVGPLALEKREDVQRAWARLMAYMEAGGHLLHLLEQPGRRYFLQKIERAN